VLKPLNPIYKRPVALVGRLVRLHPVIWKTSPPNIFWKSLLGANERVDAILLLSLKVFLKF
jgi:hypothetical protein